MNNARELNHIAINNSLFSEMQNFEVAVWEIQHWSKMEKLNGKTACQKEALTIAVLPESRLGSKVHHKNFMTIDLEAILSILKH